MYYENYNEWSQMEWDMANDNQHICELYEDFCNQGKRDKGLANYILELCDRYDDLYQAEPDLSDNAIAELDRVSRCTQPGAELTMDEYIALVAEEADLEVQSADNLHGLEEEADGLTVSDFNDFCRRWQDSNLKDTQPGKKPTND